jgi:hypothetical protein
VGDDVDGVEGVNPPNAVLSQTLISMALLLPWKHCHDVIDLPAIHAFSKGTSVLSSPYCRTYLQNI